MRKDKLERSLSKKDRKKINLDVSLIGKNYDIISNEG